MRKLNKLGRTLKICYTIFMAHTFGDYIHTIWDGNQNYHLYKRNGNVYMIPYGPFEESDL